ncbi:MAG TPA: glycosyltransferase [Coriobacteriia bacterium]
MPAEASGAGPRISVVIPAFNEQDNVAELVERVSNSVGPLGSFEIVIVDDGSTDATWARICEAAEADPQVVGIRLQRNFGQHPAVTAGFDASRGDIVVTLDADLQNPPEEIPKLVERLGPDCDVASGWRYVRHDIWLRRLPSMLVNTITAKLTGVKLHDYGCMLRAYKREVIDMLARCPEVNRTITALVSWLGVSIVEVPVEHAARKYGKSRYGYWRLVRMTFDILTGFTTTLLQWVSVTGIVVSLVGLAASVVLIVWRILFGSGPIGITTFLSVLLFLAGIQVAAVGVVGEYIGRIYVQVQGRPYYITRERTSESADAKDAGVRAVR